MANRVKEDEKNERIIRGLLKLPENRRCINCNSLGPQYVCTNFCTFICTTCSGIHREFTHRVKSISMAKFTSQEVTALQEGGNQRAKETYFKELDLERHSFPANSNVDRLRDFIKHAYVDRRYSGGRSSENPTKGKMDGKEDESRRTDSYQGGSRSPQYGDTYERPYSGKSSPGGRSTDERSPGFGQESPQHRDYKSPARTGVVNDWRRENRFGNEKKVENYRVSDGDSKLEGRSPEGSKDLDPSSPPIVRPVREILGENVIPLRIIEPPRINESRTTAVSVHTKRTASSSSLGSVDSTEVETKVDVSRSLIDFDDVSEPPASSIPQPYQTIATQTAPQTGSSDNDNWASFDTAPELKFFQGGSSESKLESVLSELSVSTSVPDFPSVGNMNTSHFTGRAPLTMSTSGLVSTPSVSGSNSFVGGAGVPLWPTMQTQQTSLFPSTVAQPMTEQYMPNHAWNVAQAANSQGPPSHSTAQLSLPVTKPVQDLASGVEVKPSGRKELPADIFSGTYSYYPAPVPGWHAGPPQGMNVNMLYNTMPMQQFTHPGKSSNPFDLKNEPPQVHASLSLPSLASLQGSLPAGQPALGLIRSASVDTPPSAWMSSQPPFYSSSLPPLPSYPSSMPPAMYVGQQLHSIQPRAPGVGGFGGERVAYSNADHQMVERFSAPASAHSSSSSSRNPFE